MGEARLSPGYVAWYLPCQETLVQVLFTTPIGQEHHVLEWLDGQGLLTDITYTEQWQGRLPTWPGADTPEELQTHFIVARQGNYTTSWIMAIRAWDAWMAQQACKSAQEQQQAEGRRCRLVLRLADALSDYPEPDRFMDRLWVAAGEYGLVSIHWWSPRFEARRVIDAQGPRWERPARPNAMEIDCAHAGSALQYSDRQAEVMPGRARWRLCVPVNERQKIAGAGVLSFTADRRFTIEESDAFEQCAGFLERALRGMDERVALDQHTSLREDELRHSLNALRLEVERTKRNEAIQAALFQIARLASEQAHSRNFNERVHGILRDLIRVDTLAILLTDQEQEANTGDLSLVYLRERALAEGGQDIPQLEQKELLNSRSSLSMALANQVTQRMAPIMARDPRKGSDAESWMAAPLLDEGKPIGALVLRASEGYGYRPEDLDVLTLCAQQVGHAISRQRAVALLEARVAERTYELRQQQALAERQALHDPLTELPNRRHLEQRLHKALDDVSAGKPLVLMFLDLDHFKSVNDRLGHAAGDTVLVEASKRMIKGLRPSDFVARLAGDEFIVLIQPAGDDETAQKMADRLVASLSQPMSVHNNQVAKVGCSIGWTKVVCAEGLTPETLLEKADQAMYAAKRGGRGRAIAFDLNSDCMVDLPISGEIETLNSMEQAGTCQEQSGKLSDQENLTLTGKTNKSRTASKKKARTRKSGAGENKEQINNSKSRKPRSRKNIGLIRPNEEPETR